MYARITKEGKSCHMAAMAGSKNALQVLASAGKVRHWSLSSAYS